MRESNSLIGELLCIEGKDREDVKTLVNELIQKYGVKLMLSVTDLGDLKLWHLVVPKEFRKQGVGTTVMEILTRYADDHNMRMVLTTGVKDPHLGTTSASRLKKFYKQFGFVENHGKDFRISDNMIRFSNRKVLQ